MTYKISVKTCRLFPYHLSPCGIIIAKLQSCVLWKDKLMTNLWLSSHKEENRVPLFSSLCLSITSYYQIIYALWLHYRIITGKFLILGPVIYLSNQYYASLWQNSQKLIQITCFHQTFLMFFKSFIFCKHNTAQYSGH